MRRTSRLVFGLVFTLLAHQSALAVEPDNQPWDKIDRVLNVEMHIAGECLIESLRSTRVTDYILAAEPAPGLISQEMIND
jgi:hypothetical protein